MNTFKINTTAYNEEDFTLMTDLSKKEIVKVITPIVTKERKGGEEYDNETLIYALQEAYPDKDIFVYGIDEIITI
jgi:hypothetical protein